MSGVLRRLLVCQCVAILAFGLGCGSRDDAGDLNFVVSAMQHLLARSPRSAIELDVLVKLADESGREAVVDVLMEQPEFVEYWSRVLMDDLLVTRETFGTTDTPEECYTETLLATHLYDELVEHLRSRPATVEFCPDDQLPIAVASAGGAPIGSEPMEISVAGGIGVDALRGDFEGSRARSSVRRIGRTDRSRGTESLTDRGFGAMQAALPLEPPVPPLPAERAEHCESFTMGDVLAAGIREDRLEVIYRAGLVAMITHEGTGNRAAKNFMQAYLGRDPACVQCHSTNYSTTEPVPRNDHWARHFPAHSVDLEASAFSFVDEGSLMDGGLGGATFTEGVEGFFHANTLGTGNSPGEIYPFGIAESCARQGFRAPGSFSVPGAHGAAFVGISGDYGGVTLMDAFAYGVQILDFDDVRPQITVELPEDGSVQVCTACHEDQALAPELVARTSRMSSTRIADIAGGGSYTGYMDAVGSGLWNEGVLENEPSYTVPTVYSDPTEGFAHLVAMSIVDDVFEEVLGGSLVMPNGFPRNRHASAWLERWTSTFVENGWSLRALLKEIVLSPFVNRHAPAETRQRAYVMDMVVNPWAAVPEAQRPGDNRNGQGDLVHRWSVPSLLIQLQHALLWPEPPRFPSDNESSYADLTFQKAVGAYLNLNFTGSPDLVLPAMLAFEREIGAGRNPGPGDDYVDRLVEPAVGLTVEQAMLAVKGRLLTDSRWWGDPSAAGLGTFGITTAVNDERSLAAQLVNGSLSEPAAQHEDAVRAYLVSVIKSPYFVLSGMPAFERGSGPPPFDPDVPCVDELCTWTEYCEHYAQIARDLGYGDGLNCGAPTGFQVAGSGMP